MSFYSYDGIPDSVLDKQHTTSTGETYTLRHNESLKVEMSYVGKGKTNANAQGWERNSQKYFEALYQKHPEMFSKKNAARVKDGQSPIVDQKMISHNPDWAQYRNQPLVHHHIGGNGEAVAVPKNAHKGSGEIHNPEKSAGITDNCKSFSKKCSSDPNSIGKTTSQLHSKIETKSNTGKVSNSSSSNKSANNLHGSKSSGDSLTRSDAVRNAIGNNNGNQQFGRSQSVETASQSSGISSSSNRSDSVRGSVQSVSSGSNSHSQSSNGSGSSQGSNCGGQSSGHGSSEGSSIGSSNGGGQNR